MSLGQNAFHPKKFQEAWTLCPWNIPFPFTERVQIKTVDGLKWVALATMALSMGVNFPHARYIENFGPSGSLLDFHWQMGQAGRDRHSSDVILYFYGQQLAHCDDNVHTFLKSTGCYCVASYLSFDPHIVPLLPSHKCCSYCTMSCTCDTLNLWKGPKNYFKINL